MEWTAIPSFAVVTVDENAAEKLTEALSLKISASTGDQPISSSDDGVICQKAHVNQKIRKGKIFI
jgi:hypothetical protein